ncbi:MAG: hypothetical protein KC621_07085, partial [Myxococcales bacterium]|nr:hypothetical protein [Myxococcales bacterium]
RITRCVMPDDTVVVPPPPPPPVRVDAGMPGTTGREGVPGLDAPGTLGGGGCRCDAARSRAVTTGLVLLLGLALFAGRRRR